MANVQLFSKTTQALFYNFNQKMIQQMLDFDYVCGRETPSVAGIIHRGCREGSYRSLFWGQQRIEIPVHATVGAACAAHPTADVFINSAPRTSAADSTVAALKQRTIKVVAIIEEVPEVETKQLIAYALLNNKVIIGPATAGGIKAGAFKIGGTAGTIGDILGFKLYLPGSVGFVSKYGGMANKMYSTIARATDGIYESIAIGGNVVPGSTLSDHVLRFNKIPQIKMIVVLGELGGRDEYTIVEALKQGKINKPVVAWVSRGPQVGGELECGQAKNQALKDVGAVVPTSFEALEDAIKDTFTKLQEIAGEKMISDGKNCPMKEVTCGEGSQHSSEDAGKSGLPPTYIPRVANLIRRDLDQALSRGSWKDAFYASFLGYRARYH